MTLHNIFYIVKLLYFKTYRDIKISARFYFLRSKAFPKMYTQVQDFEWGK